jgi:hypothetical protein
MVAVSTAVAVAVFIKSRLSISSSPRAKLAAEKQRQVLLELIQFTDMRFHGFTKVARTSSNSLNCSLAALVPVLPDSIASSFGSDAFVFLNPLKTLTVVRSRADW